MNPTGPLLEIENCTIRFGGLAALSDIDLKIGDGELIGLIGPNGAGKTTLFNLVTGVYQPSAGRIRFGGINLAGKKPYQITSHGIARTFQNIRLFRSLSVFDNVRVAFHLHVLSGMRRVLWRGRAFYEEEESITGKVTEALKIFRLDRLRDARANTLSYGDQRRLEIVRALVTRPRLLLLDEPAAGMNPTEKVELMRLIGFVQETYRLSILLVEHDMRVVMGICQRIAVLDHGEKIAEGTPAEIQRNPAVIEAYLGTDQTPCRGSAPGEA